ncbi:MAG: outer membrane protein transport protein, partial [Pseudomonadota bacterium]
MNKCARLMPAIAFAAIALHNQSATAGGFALIEQGGSGMGNAYAGAAAVSADASTVWFNPAGMLELADPQLAVAGHVISVENEFSDRGTTLNPAFGLAPVSGATVTDPGGATVIPNFYYVRALRDNLAFGVGVSVPFGNSTDYGRDWVGRYQAVESAVSVIDINPSVAYRVNDQLSIGGGISVQLFDATLGSAVDSGATCLGLTSTGTLPLAACANAGLTTPGNLATDGYAEITGDSVATTFNFGVLYKPQPATKLGFAYRHSVDHELEGA